MSQHRYKTQHNGTEITVMLGWDRPLKYYFMVVEKEVSAVHDGAEGDAMDDEDTLLYSNLLQPDAFELTLEDYKKVLDEQGISVPESMFQQVELDQANQVGNRSVYYNADGSFHEV